MSPVTPHWQIAFERGPNWIIVQVQTTEEEQPEGEPLAQQVQGLLTRHLTNRLVLELERGERVSDHLVGQLQEIREWLLAREGVMRLCGLSSTQREQLRAAGFENRFLAYHDRAEAIRGGSRPRHPR